VLDRFAVEVDRRVVGLAVRCDGGYRFFASHPDYFSLEGRLFPRARTLRGSVERLKRSGRRGGTAEPSPSLQ